MLMRGMVPDADCSRCRYQVRKTDFPHQMKDAQGLYRLWFSPAVNLIGLNRGHVQRSRILFCSASRKASGYAVGRTFGGEIQIWFGHAYRHF